MKELEALKLKYEERFGEWAKSFNTTNRLDYQVSVIKRNINRFAKTKNMDGKTFIYYNDDVYELTKVGEDDDIPKYHVMKNKRLISESYWEHASEIKFEIVMGKI